MNSDFDRAEMSYERARDDAKGVNEPQSDGETVIPRKSSKQIVAEIMESADTLPCRLCATLRPNHPGDHEYENPIACGLVAVARTIAAHLERLP